MDMKIENIITSFYNRIDNTGKYILVESINDKRVYYKYFPFCKTENIVAFLSFCATGNNYEEQINEGKIYNDNNISRCYDLIIKTTKQMKKEASFGIIDRDYDHKNEIEDINNITQTYYHDLEMSLFAYYLKDYSKQLLENDKDKINIFIKKLSRILHFTYNQGLIQSYGSEYINDHEDLDLIQVILKITINQFKKNKDNTMSYKIYDDDPYACAMNKLKFNNKLTQECVDDILINIQYRDEDKIEIKTINTALENWFNKDTFDKDTLDKIFIKTNGHIFSYWLSKLFAEFDITKNEDDLLNDLIDCNNQTLKLYEKDPIEIIHDCWKENDYFKPENLDSFIEYIFINDNNNKFNECYNIMKSLDKQNLRFDYICKHLKNEIINNNDTKKCITILNNYEFNPESSQNVYLFLAKLYLELKLDIPNENNKKINNDYKKIYNGILLWCKLISENDIGINKPEDDKKLKEAISKIKKSNN